MTRKKLFVGFEFLFFFVYFALALDCNLSIYRWRWSSLCLSCTYQPVFLDSTGTMRRLSHEGHQFVLCGVSHTFLRFLRSSSAAISASTSASSSALAATIHLRPCLHAAFWAGDHAARTSVIRSIFLRLGESIVFDSMVFWLWRGFNFFSKLTYFGGREGLPGRVSGHTCNKYQIEIKIDVFLPMLGGKPPSQPPLCQIGKKIETPFSQSSGRVKSNRTIPASKLQALQVIQDVRRCLPHCRYPSRFRHCRHRHRVRRPYAIRGPRYPAQNAVPA